MWTCRRQWEAGHSLSWVAITQFWSKVRSIQPSESYPCSRWHHACFICSVTACYCNETSPSAAELSCFFLANYPGSFFLSGFIPVMATPPTVLDMHHAPRKMKSTSMSQGQS